ncbi:MAG: hypothetical protein L6R41_004681 [Letrouitia leprolyta]|nr:MAG: hypothetical protein L6R41_004681 [Letrouitia leprolyta]
MSGVESNPVVPQESKSAKKKKAKAEAAVKDTTTQPNVISENAKFNAEIMANGADGAYESPYMRELYKSIRSVKKKLVRSLSIDNKEVLLTVKTQNATQKVDSIIAENPGQTLDELLAARKINQDQKAQAQKKPALQASVAQLEEQVAQYKQFDEDYQKRLVTEKAALETAHKEELEKVKETSISAAKAESAKEAKEKLLVLSKFLRAAAAKRQGGDETSPENRAFEGALLLVYGGEAGAVAAMESLIAGTDDKVPTVDQVLSEYTYKQVRDLAFEYAPYAAEEAWAEDVAQSEPNPPAAEESAPEVGTDPTVAHAGLTELDTAAEPTSNGVSHHIDTPTVPDASNIDAGAANAAAADPNWDAKLSASADSGPDGWVEVARDPAETETGTTATPAGMTSTQSWAEDVPADPQWNSAPSEPRLALMVSTKFVEDVALDLKEKIAAVDVGVADSVAIAAGKVVTVVVEDTVGTAVEGREAIADVVEADEVAVAVVTLPYNECLAVVPGLCRSGGVIQVPWLAAWSMRSGSGRDLRVSQPGSRFVTAICLEKFVA